VTTITNYDIPSMKGIIASSPLFIQPHTNPFAIVVHQMEEGDHWVCHYHYPRNNAFEHGHYGTLTDAMVSFSNRVLAHTKQTIECGGSVDHYPPLPPARLRRKLEVLPPYTDRFVFPLAYDRGDGSHGIIGEINSFGGVDDECKDVAERLVALWNANIEPA
jgi:hypothetical protein